MPLSSHDGPLDPNRLPGEYPDGPVRESFISNMLNIADLTFQALTGEPIPTKTKPAPKTQSVMKFEPGDIFELTIAASQVGHFVLSSDSTTCAVCGHIGKDMRRAGEHHPCCRVARLWNAIDAIKITVESISPEGGR